jgi:exodeoxyribonuclease VII small subunit
MAKRKPAAADDAPSFEQALAELEALVEAMENQQLPLEQLVDHYEQGSRLLRRCESILQSARQRLQTIDLRAAASAEETAEETAEPTGPPAAPAPGADAEDDDIRLF